MNTKNQDIVNLVEVLARLGLKHVILSPGSRNAPLIKAFSRHPDIRCHSVVDERSAGFVGLGIAQQLREPVAVVCTSGSALLNYGPAVCEAHYQRLPLLVISADRPQEWINQGDGQAINQREVFRNFSKGYFELKESRGHQNSQWHNERSTAEAWNLARILPQGPVHLNVPLSEPLYEMADTAVNLLSEPTRTFQGAMPVEDEVADELIKTINGHKKIMVLIGQQHPDTVLAERVHRFSQHPHVVVLTETTANLFGNGYIDQIDNALATIGTGEKPDFAPDILITFGGMVVTRRLKQFLRQFPAGQHIHIDPSPVHTDTYQHLTKLILSTPFRTLERILPGLTPVDSDYRELWLTRKAEASARHRAYCAGAPFSDLTVFGRLLTSLPENCVLQIGNSSPIRYVQLFENKTSITHFCNRGVSGIDGCTSTAVGAAIGSGKTTVLISGEISFLYDNNGLWNKEIPNTFVAIVINNAGGNIFRIIDGPDQFEEMPEFIETTHGLSVKPLAELHGFRYLSAQDETSLQTAVSQVFDQSQKTILEIFTPQYASPEILKKYWNNLS